MAIDPQLLLLLLCEPLAHRWRVAARLGRPLSSLPRALRQHPPARRGLRLRVCTQMVGRASKARRLELHLSGIIGQFPFLAPLVPRAPGALPCPLCSGSPMSGLMNASRVSGDSHSSGAGYADPLLVELFD